MKTILKKFILASLLSCAALLAVGSAYAATLYFPHIDTKLPWETEIAIINTGNQAVTGTLNALSNEGQSIETKAVTLSAHGRRQITVADEFTDHTNIGYILFDADSDRIQGYTKFYQTGVYRVAIPAVTEVNAGDIYIPHIDSSASWWTGISLVNTTSAAKELTITFNNSQVRTINLAAKGHRAFDIASLFDNRPPPDIHSAVITNASGIIGLELFGRNLGGSQMEGILLTDKTASTIYYPRVAGGEWWTGIVAYNPSESACAILVTPYSDRGTPLATSTFTIPGKGKYVGTAASLGLPAETAWFRIDSTSPISGFELISSNDAQQLAAYAGGGIAGTAGVFAKIEKHGWTAIDLVNTENSAASVDLTAHADDGTVVSTAALTIGGHARSTSSAEGLFPQDVSSATYIAYSADKNLLGFQLNGSSDWTVLDGLPGLGGTAPVSEGPVTIFILNTGDIHESSQNLGKIFNYVNKQRQKRPGRVVLLDAGDMLTHYKRVNPQSDWQGQHDRMYKWASSMNYDAMVFGNHDFVETVKGTQQLIAKYGLPAVSANLQHPDLSVPPYKIIPLRIPKGRRTVSVKIGVIGLADQDKVDFHDRNTRDKERLEVHPVDGDIVRALIDTVKGQSDFIVFLSHNKDDVDRNTIAALTGDENYIIVGGHSHRLIPKKNKISESRLVKSGVYGECVGSTKVSWDPDSRRITAVTVDNID